MFGFEKLLVGQTLGRWYRIDEVLGGGGFGVVFRATDLRPERAAKTVAVKVLALPPGLDADGRARMRDRFRQEAAFAAALPHHPNVVPIFDYGTDRGLDYLVMELLRGEDLRRRLARPEPIALPVALRILRDAARGVAVGHRAGLIHRDVKPGNVFLSESADGAPPTVRVLDFGIAKRVEAGDDLTATQLTRHGEGFFSGRYASPEQLRRETGLSRASDVFSLGVVGFELLTRTRLFEGADQTRRESGLPVPLPSLSARNPEVPPAVEAVLTRALAHDPADRFRDAAAFEEALRAACREAGLRLDAPLRASSPGAAPVEGTSADERTRVAAPESADRPTGTVEHGRTATAEDDATAFAPSPGATGAPPEHADAEAEAATVSADPEDAAELPVEERRTPFQRRRRWRRPHQISRRRGMAIAAVVVLLLGSAVVMSAAAVGSGAALLDQLFGGEATGAPAARARAPRLSAADANRRGLAAFRRSDFATALEDFGDAHRRSPGVAEYHNNYAWALFKSGRYRPAARELERVVSRHPRRWIARENLAAALLAAGDTAAAVQALERLVALAPPPSRRRDAERLLTRLRGDGDGFVAPDVVVHAGTHDVVEAEVHPAAPVAPEPPAGAIVVDTVAAGSPALPAPA